MCDIPCGADEVHLSDEDLCRINETIREIDCRFEELRRFLYRNVACEARKSSDIARHIPQIPGWS